MSVEEISEVKLQFYRNHFWACVTAVIMTKIGKGS